MASTPTAEPITTAYGKSLDDEDAAAAV